MTTVTFHSEGGRVTGFTAAGHSGLAPEGEDVLCAAVTSAVRLVECAVNDVLGLHAPVRARKKDACVSLKLPGGLSQDSESVCQTLLTALMVYLTRLREEYPEHLIVFHHDSMEV